MYILYYLNYMAPLHIDLVLVLLVYNLVIVSSFFIFYYSALLGMGSVKSKPVVFGT
jgi:hypothetical protein